MSKKVKKQVSKKQISEEEIKELLSGLSKKTPEEIEAEILEKYGFRNYDECIEYLEKIGAFREMKELTSNFSIRE